MQARLTVYMPDSAAIVRTVAAGATLRIGRAPDNDLVVGHASISRRHAELRPDDGGWRLCDLGSKNGCRVDGDAVAPDGPGRALPRACWLRLGDVVCEFALLAPAESAAAAARRDARRDAATAHTLRLDGVRRLDDLLDASLRGVLDLAQCDRGFVLLEGDGGFRVRASLDLDPRMLDRGEFSGSVGAVERALRERAPLVANDVGSDAWLAARQSVIAARLSALICLPLLDGAHALGAIYADRARPGPAITTLDLELLEAFTERAAMWIVARRASEWLETSAPPAADWDRIVAGHGIDRQDATRLDGAR